MDKKVTIFSAFVSLVFSTSCQNHEENVPQFEVDDKWNPPCTDLSKSPEITVIQIPQGTVQLLVELTDLHLPALDYDSGYIEYRGQNIIPAGTVKGTYAGSSPLYGSVHSYEIKIEALGPHKELLGIGKKAHPYPPEGEEQIRWQPCSRKSSN